MKLALLLLHPLAPTVILECRETVSNLGSSIPSIPWFITKKAAARAMRTNITAQERPWLANKPFPNNGMRDSRSSISFRRANVCTVYHDEPNEAVANARTNTNNEGIIPSLNKRPHIILGCRAGVTAKIHFRMCVS